MAAASGSAFSGSGTGVLEHPDINASPRITRTNIAARMEFQRDERVKGEEDSFRMRSPAIHLLL
ncbi:MAG TPA: hypothetical protein VII90_08515 [Anaerolineales bacterium]